MLVWRICKQKHLATALDGVGAEKVGGRWNHPGTRIVYTASSLSLASLELFVHLEPNLVPDDLVSVAIELPPRVSVETLLESDLPRDWRAYPAPETLQDIGANWAAQQRSLALVVPSAVTPQERNVLLNPLHRQMRLLPKPTVSPFHCDPRMWK